MRPKPNLTIALGVMLAATSAARGGEEWSLSWCEFGPLVAGEKVRLVLTDGDSIRGHALAVRGDSLRTVITKSSDRKNHPLGETAIERDAIEKIEILRNEKKKGKIIGTAAGIFGGMFVATGVAYLTGNWAATLGAWVGTGVLGFAQGNAADREVIHVRLRPGDQQCAESPDLIGGDIVPPLIGVGGEPSYSTREGGRVHVSVGDGHELPLWNGVRWSDADPAERKPWYQRGAPR